MAVFWSHPNPQHLTKIICLVADDERRIRGVVPQHTTEGNKLLCLSILPTGGFKSEEAVQLRLALLRTAFSFSVVPVCIKGCKMTMFSC